VNKLSCVAQPSEKSPGCWYPKAPQCYFIRIFPFFLYQIFFLTNNTGFIYSVFRSK